MKLVKTGCFFERDGSPLFFVRRVLSGNEMPEERDYYDQGDVCWTTRLYFHPLSLKKIFSAFVDQFEWFAKQEEAMEAPPTNPCVSGFMLLPSMRDAVSSARTALEDNDPLSLQIWFLYFYLHFAPARSALAVITNTAVHFLAEPFLRMRFCILFSSPIEKAVYRERLETWVHATLQPMVLRQYHLMILGTHTFLHDHFFLADTTDYGEEEGLAGREWKPKNYEEWLSFSFPGGECGRNLARDMREELSPRISLLRVHRQNEKVVYPLFCNVTAAQVPRSLGFVILFQSNLITNALPDKREVEVDEPEGVDGDEDVFGDTDLKEINRLCTETLEGENGRESGDSDAGGDGYEDSDIFIRDPENVGECWITEEEIYGFKSV